MTSLTSPREGETVFLCRGAGGSRSINRSISSLGVLLMFSIGLNKDYMQVKLNVSAHDNSEDFRATRCRLPRCLRGIGRPRATATRPDRSIQMDPDHVST